MKKIFRVFIKIARGTTFLLILFVLSAFLVSIRIDQEKVSNPYCLYRYVEDDFDFSSEEVKEYTVRYECNTLYVYLVIKDDMTKKETIALLTDYMIRYEHYECFFQFEIHGKQFDPFFASINPQEQMISYTGKKE